MHDPGTCIIGFEAYSNVVRRRGSSVNDVAFDGVDIIVIRAPSTPDHGESMSVKVNWMLKYDT